MKKILASILLSLSIGSAALAQINSQTLNYSHGKYVGEVANGKANGQGTYTASKTGITYSGQFVNDTFSGQGTMQWKNGDKYVGIWKNDSATSGTMTFANGQTAYGTVRNGVFKAIGPIGNPFPAELIGEWGTKEGCIAEITKNYFEEGGGIISCSLTSVNALDGGFSGTLSCSSDGHPNKRSIKYQNKTLIISGEKYSRCKS